MRKSFILIGFGLIIGSLAFPQNAINNLSFGYDYHMISDNYNIFTFKTFDSYATAYDINSGDYKILSLPSLQNISDMKIQYANTLQDGYLLAVSFIKSSKNDAKGKTASGIFFYDKDATYKDMFNFSDRKFIAAAPWDAQNIVIFWFKIAAENKERWILADLTIVDHKGHWVADIQPQVFYDPTEFFEKYSTAWSECRLYWQNNILMLVDSISSEVVYINKEMVVIKRIKGKPDAVPGSAKKVMSGIFKVSSKHIALLDAFNTPGGIQRYWVDMDQPDMVNPRNVKANKILIIGDQYYLSKPTPSGTALFLITEENWQSLLK